jgi:hypothetical protein
MTPRFRQSYAKTLLTDCPALVKKQLDNDSRNPTRAMQKGSLLDYLTFGLDDRYEVVDARYKSGPREGELATDYTCKEAREAKEDILSRGLTPALEVEIDALAPTARALRARIQLMAEEMSGGRAAGHDYAIEYQPHMEWTSELGVDCHGTPDVVVLVFMRDLIKVCTIDVKHTAFLQPAKFDRQVYSMCWDVQGMAYAEGSKAWAESEHSTPAFHMDHYILASSSLELGLPPCARPLAPTYKEVGRRRWNKAQGMWKECLASGSWPSYQETPVEPNRYVVSTWLEAYDESTFTEDAEP